MQLARGGPDFPAELLARIEAGDVVFFCGAGISRPLGLPEFGGLVETVYANLSEDMDLGEAESVSKKSYDRALGQLEIEIGVV
ncbi:MAG: hypothetical protein KDC27_06190 [Acidobacteria bacterium]|nr:hypothetical protein [Acidobacteriota bacterium]